MPQLLRAIRPMFKFNKWRICRDDTVYILSGPDKGKTGNVLEVFKDRRLPQVIVEGRNLRKKKVRTGPGDDDYFVVTMEAPLHYSHVQVADPDTGRPIRVIFMFTPDGKRVRARKVLNPTINDILPSPTEDADPRAGLVGKKDTPADLARSGNYIPSAGFPFRVRNLERIWAGLHPDAPALLSLPPLYSRTAASPGGTSHSSEETKAGEHLEVGSGKDVQPQTAATSSFNSIGGIRTFCTTASTAADVAILDELEVDFCAVSRRQGMLPPPRLLLATFAVSGLRHRLGGVAGAVPEG